MAPCVRRRISIHLLALWRDTDGVILPYVTLMLVVIIGMAALALDGARYMGLQTQLQNAVDALAIAGAAELDRLPDSEQRAVRAIQTLVRNPSSFGFGALQNLEIAQIRFLSELPQGDADPISTATAAQSSVNARFVFITIRPVRVETILPAAFFGGANTVTTGASAVAGFDQVVCRFPPLFVCNPYETDDSTYEGASRALQIAMANPRSRRRLLRLHQYRGDSQYAPGDYGFLDSPTIGRDDQSLLEALAKTRPAACFQQSHVDIRPGSLLSAREAFNVRFDIYEGALLANRRDPNYVPAENVRKGYVGGACRGGPATNWPIGSPPNQATGLPLDRTWLGLAGRVGEGDWDFDTYWQVNHGGDGRPPPTADGGLANNANPPTRYGVYRYEIEQGFVADRSAGGETGAPACYGGDLTAGGPDRRVLYAAVINCRSLSLDAGARWNIPVAAFAKFFLTLPLSRSQTDLYVEPIALVGPGDPANFDLVQLYR
jgi:hypothetical protein